MNTTHSFGWTFKVKEGDFHTEKRPLIMSLAGAAVAVFAVSVAVLDIVKEDKTETVSHRRLISTLLNTIHKMDSDIYILQLETVIIRKEQTAKPKQPSQQ